MLEYARSVVLSVFHKEHKCSRMELFRVELARRRAENEARMKYLLTMHMEREGLQRHTHRLHRPFYFSYFDLFSFFDITTNA